ncbi:sensor histidine kinase regulating citrate/malate metabolism [Nonomuraea thailandensis]|uniref:histidine kinase n=1 Tax=Nonomuraea thailandensis TaxID=1188745 RepID=A0A9X2K4B0_9ACTN|nr:sensor histidine kinase [Nonomuraea thailandensis]MCP2359095.1 sensor histidine kinase regulating citrate/malate metabolism [Nonomuraea thailandensis]
MEGNPMRRWSLAGQMLVLQLLVVAVTATGGAVLALLQAHELLQEEAGATARAVAVTVATSPDVLEALGERDPTVRLQPYAQRARAATGVDFITIMKTDGTRYTHPNEAEIGRRFLGHIEPALRGETFTETYTGTLGASKRAVTPVMADGRVRALVSAGITIDRISARLRGQLAWGGLIVALALGLGAAGTWLVTVRLRRQTHGLGPVELGRIHDHHDAVLHAVREGLLLIGRDGTLTLCNDAARLLLGLPADAEGRHVRELGLREVPTAGEERIHLAGDRVLAVNSAASRLGTVVTVRDHTELQALTGQLDAERGFAESLRSAAHEAANRLHTVITLVELGRTEQAVALGTAELRAAQELTDRVVGAVREPVLAALLLGKSAEAAERGSELVITQDSELDDLGLDARELVTIVGNLIDNAIDAASRVEVHLSAGERHVLIRVSDDGPGLTGTEAFEKGWTTKGDGRGLGLALVGQAVRRLGGTIEAKGSTFTVRLPTS